MDYYHFSSLEKVCEICHKNLQFPTDEIEGDCLLVTEVLEGNYDEDYLVTDTALQSLDDNLLSVG
jgi:hypothetical protein